MWNKEGGVCVRKIERNEKEIMYPPHGDESTLEKKAEDGVEVCFCVFASRQK